MFDLRTFILPRTKTWLYVEAGCCLMDKQNSCLSLTTEALVAAIPSRYHDRESQHKQKGSSPMNRVSSTAFAVFAILFSAHSYSQNAAGALPADPTALMTLAHERNGLTGSGVKPWHMHGTYHSYKDGKPEYEGTYEEWWISPTQYKVSFSNPKETQTDFATGTALLRDGAQEWLNGPELLLRSSVVDPLPDPAQLKDYASEQ